MLTRRLFSFGGLAVAAGFAALRRVGGGRTAEGIALSGIGVGIAPLIVDILNERPSLQVGTARGIPAVYYEGRFLGWLPEHARVRPGKFVEMESARLDQYGKLQVYVRV